MHIMQSSRLACYMQRLLMVRPTGLSMQPGKIRIRISSVRNVIIMLC